MPITTASAWERSASPGGGLEVVVRFNGSVVEEVRITGRGGLRFIASCIGLGIMPWIWELPDSQTVAGDDATVITSTSIDKVALMPRAAAAPPCRPDGRPGLMPFAVWVAAGVRPEGPRNGPSSALGWLGKR